jgi:hypothetical protein
MNRLLELAGVPSIIVEAAGGKRQGAINMILATLSWKEGGALTHDEVSKALGLAYDAGVADADKASTKN